MPVVGAGALTLVGAFVAGGGDALSTAVLSAVAVAMLSTAGGNALNDYVDRDLDVIDSPERPIASGAVGARTALTVGVACLGAALATATMLPPLALAIAGVNLFALVLYTSLLKGRVGAGNVLVALLSGSTLLFGGAAAGHPETTAVLAVLSVLPAFAREILLDVRDMRGDDAAGLDTLPLCYGEGSARTVAAATLFLAVFVSPVPYLVGTVGVIYLLAVVAADAAWVLAALRINTPSRRAHPLLVTGVALATVALAADTVMLG